MALLKNGSIKIKAKKFYLAGIVLVSGFLLLSVDNCEELRMREQQEYAKEHAARAEQQQARERQEQEWRDAQNQARAGSQQGTAAGGTRRSGTGAQTGTNAGQGAITRTTGAEYVTSISGKSWKLVELRFTDRTVVLNRSELSADQTDLFTLNIDNERISGRAAPNRYMTSYQAEDNNALKIQPIASTMMALIVTDPQRITEPQYFQYLGKVKSWIVNQNRLELTSADAANKTVIMVFSN